MLRIRQAETALKDGRLDEAFELIRESDVRSHRKGQKLVTKLVKALVTRGRQHLEAGHLDKATADGQKAYTLGGNVPEVAALQQAANDARERKVKDERRQADVLHAARAHAANGELTLCDQALGTHASHRAQVIRDELAVRRVSAEGALARARSALDRSDYQAALQSLVAARDAHGSNAEVASLLAEAADQALERVDREIDQGRLDLARPLLEQLRGLGQRGLDVKDRLRLLEECRRAAACIDRGLPRQAVEILRRLCCQRAGATWITQVCQHAEDAANRLEQLRGGPLGSLLDNTVSSTETPERPPDHRVEVQTVRLAGSDVPAEARLPRQFMIQVDGAGSYLVLRDRSVTLGPAGSSRHPDVGLLADSSVPAVTVERMDEDYFLTSSTTVQVNDADVTRKLLASGDRIALAPRCRMKFTIPNAASISAVLNLSGTRLPKSDARRVILMDQSIIMGPAASAHIRTDLLTQPAILHVREDRLFLRSEEEVTIDGRPADRHQGIPVGRNIRVGPLSFVVTRVE